MQTIQSLESITANYQNCVIALGTFDGIHLGHKNIINTAKMYARQYNSPTIIFSFANHPFVELKPTEAPYMLLGNADKQQIIAQLGVDILVNVTFDKTLAELKPQEFIKMLVTRFTPKHIVVGENFTYGDKGAGNATTLRQECQAHNIELSAIPLVKVHNLIVSSSNIRNAVLQGDITLANSLLGRNHFVRGTVQHGNKIGRTLGFPTANIALDKLDIALPSSGIFAVRINHNEKLYDGVANIGYNPTITADSQTKKLEVYIFDFEQEIYNENLQIFFHKKIRDEIKFADINALKQQIIKDVTTAKQYFENN